MLAGFAFFDLDETLLSFKSMFEFRRRLFMQGAEPGLGAERYQQFLAEAQALSARFDRAWVNRWFYRSLEGQREAQIRQLAYIWCGELLRQQTPVFVEESVNLLERLRRQGFEPVAVSGSAEMFVAPFLHALNIAQRLCVRLEVAPDGRLTGNLLPPQTIGVGKQQAVLDFLDQHAVSPHVCYAVGDHHTDLPMLELVGHPVVVTGDPRLDAHAKLQRWPMLRPRINRLNLARWVHPACTQRPDEEKHGQPS
jgi:HAD superfamily hydrolase (TIGR01490 family)